MSPGTLEEAAALLAALRDLSGRLARFEDVLQAELDAFQAAKLDVLGRIDEGALL